MARELAGLDPAESILEVGCGNCQFTADLAELSRNVHAIDISSWQIQINQQRYPDIKFTAHDLSVPMLFEDGTFSAIWCSDVLEHLCQPRFALEESYRVLKTGGRLLVTAPYHGMLKNVLIALFRWERHFDPEYSHLQYFTVGMLRRLVEKAGFRHIRTETCGLNKPLRDVLVPTNILLSAVK